MSRLLLLQLVVIVLFQHRPESHVSSDNHFTPPPTFAETLIGPTDPYNFPRDATCFFITLHIGLPPQYIHLITPLSAYRAMNIFYSAQKSFLYIYPVQYSKRPILHAFCRILTLLLLCSGDIELNPGPVANNTISTSQELSYADFCNSNNLRFMHINIRSLLPKMDLFTALAHSTNPDILAVSESWLGKSTNNS
jgi:hypothetical protein